MITNGIKKQTSGYSFNKALFMLTFTFVSLIPCKGQNKIQTPTGKLTKHTSSVIGQPKLIKTQGSNEYQTINCGIVDKNGNIWFGTTGEGVYKYDGKLFTQFTVKDGLNSNHVFSILEDKTGMIWFGTSQGICRFDRKSITPVDINFMIRPVINNNSYYNESSTKNSVWSMMQDKSGKIWFGTGDGVYCYNGKFFTRFLNNDQVINKDGLRLKVVSDMLEDKAGNIWFASGMPPGYEGFCRYDGIKIESFKPKQEGWFRNVIESKNGNLFLATRHFGVWSYDATMIEGFGNGKSFNDYSQPKELFKTSLNAILEDKKGMLWIASDYGNDLGDTLGGLWHSNSPVTDSIPKTFTKITNYPVFFMLEDKDNNLWFSTRGMGLYRFDGKMITKFSE